MRRALIVGTGTVAGVAAVLALNPEVASVAAGASLPNASAAAPAASPSADAGSPSSGSSSSGSASSGSASSSTAASTTVAGSAVDVGYGTVQVQATLEGGRIVDIQALALPQNDGHSARISQQAFPMLVQQALAAQSSQISGVSGASYTSYGFVASLKAALLSAGHAA
jgi:uncharacterized protein with FMN-binding domain